MTGLKAFNLLADCVSYCHENFVCYQTDPIADSLLLSIDINNDSFLTYKRVKQKLYPYKHVRPFMTMTVYNLIFS